MRDNLTREIHGNALMRMGYNKDVNKRKQNSTEIGLREAWIKETRPLGISITRTIAVFLEGKEGVTVAILDASGGARAHAKSSLCITGMNAHIQDSSRVPREHCP